MSHEYCDKCFELISNTIHLCNTNNITKCNQCESLRKENEKLRKQLEIAKEALESYAKWGEEQMPSFMDFKNSNAKVLYREVRTFPYAKEVLEKWFGEECKKPLTYKVLKN